MPQRSMLAKIHIAKKELGLDELAYRGLLSAYHVESAKDLSEPQAAHLLQQFAQMGWKPKGSGRGKLKYDHLKSRGRGFAKPAQLRKIEAIWREVARDKSDTALSQFIRRQTTTSNSAGIANIEWLKDHHAHAVICALQQMQREHQSQLNQHE